LLGSATGPIGVDDVHAVIGTGREERIGGLVAALAERDAAAALAALDAAVAGGADPGGVLDQTIAALRDCLLASVGADPDLMTQGDGLGVDLREIGRRLGTATILAMLQILDQALARMRTSGHAVVLAEMAVVRLARLEDLDALANVVERFATGAGAAPEPRSAPALRSAPTRTGAASAAPASATAAAEREKKTTVPVDAEAGDAAAESLPAAAAAGLPADAAAAWQAGAEACGGLAADFAAAASAVAWRDGMLEVTIPAKAATAAAYLRRSEVAAGIGNALTGLAGRAVRFTIVVEPAAAGRDADSPTRPAVAVSQAALVREAAEHPLVSRARTLFDAAIRKVEPPRRRDAARPETPLHAAVGGAAEDAEPGGGDHE
jgi:DNA polymerase III gamma/tau subunit